LCAKTLHVPGFVVIIVVVVLHHRIIPFVMFPMTRMDLSLYWHVLAGAKQIVSVMRDPGHELTPNNGTGEMFNKCYPLWRSA
jgi:hypothetical protein